MFFFVRFFFSHDIKFLEPAYNALAANIVIPLINRMLMCKKITVFTIIVYLTITLIRMHSFVPSKKFHVCLLRTGLYLIDACRFFLMNYHCPDESKILYIVSVCLSYCVM